jgi:hypothetical protein
VGVGQNVEHDLGRPAKACAERRHDEGTIDEDRTLEHRIEQFLVAPRRVSEAEFGEGCAFSRIAWRTVSPAAAIIASSSAREGGFFRYSTTVGSMPALRIMASVLREVPQAGLW